MPSSQFSSIFIWWLSLFFIGLLFFPLTTKIFSSWFDKGYPFAKTLGLILAGYFTFLLSHLGLPFTSSSVWLTLFLFAIATLTLAKPIYISLKNRRLLPVFILEEILFLILLITWATIRGFAPDIRGLEKFMDFGFVNAILSSPHFPPHDPWFAGESINYYYFGHYLTAYLTRLTQIPSHIAYNLMLATLFASSFLSTLSLTSNLILKSSKSLKIALSGGLLAALLLTLGGNLHTAFYGLKDGFDRYWYPDATRFIGYNPDIDDKTIHEFPIYSFVVSDLHAHLINLPIVLLFLSLLWQYATRPKNYHQPSTIRYLPCLALTLGIIYMTNSWDFAIYLLASFFIVSLSALTSPSPRKLLSTFLTWLTIVVAALVFTLPFSLHFSQIAQGIALVTHHTPLWQLLILWGFPIFTLFSFLLFLSWSLLKNQSSPLSTLRTLPPSDLFILGLTITGITLLVIPEIIYVKDIYIASYQRANTMFKLTYQAFVIFALVNAYIFTRLARTPSLPFISRLLWSLIFLAGTASVMIYPQIAISSYYDHLKNYKGLSGSSWLKTDYPDDLAAINWVEKNTDPTVVVLEAAGDSYTDYARISSYTGRATVIGWLVHEWLWRGSYDPVGLRVEDVRLIYESEDLGLTKQLLSKYNVQYIIIGQLERDKYPGLNKKKFSQNFPLAFSQNSLQIFKTSP